MDLPSLIRLTKGHYMHWPRGNEHEGTVFLVLHSSGEADRERRWILEAIRPSGARRILAYRPHRSDAQVALYRYLHGEPVPEVLHYVTP